MTEPTQDKLIKQAEEQKETPGNGQDKTRKIISIEITDNGVNANWSNGIKRIELIGALEISKSTIENWFEEMAFKNKMAKENKIIRPGSQGNGFIQGLRGFLGKKQ